MANIIYTVPLAEVAQEAVLSYNLAATTNANVSIGGGSSGYALITDGLGNLSWSNTLSGAGTVTNVNTSGSGLGFTLTGGPITTTGTVTLNVPTSSTLRTNLTIGNVANLNLNSNSSTFLAGNGAWLVPPGSYSNSNVANYLPTFTGNIGAAFPTGAYSVRVQYVDAYTNIFSPNASIGNVIANSVNVNVQFTTTNANITTNLISANANISGNLSAGNANISGILTVTGNISSGNANLGNLAIANFFSGDGGLLSNINANYAAYAGNVTIAAQPNITSVGTLTSLNVSGNITAPNITSNTGVFAGNANGLYNIIGANVTGTVANANYAAYAGNVTIAAQPNITSVGTLSNLIVTGNINTSSYVNGIAANFTGNTTTLSQILINAGEKVTISASAPTSTTNYDITTQSIVYYTSDTTTNWTVNFRGSGSSTLDSIMTTGSSVTVVLMATNGTTGYYSNSITVDGSSVTPLWQFGTAPTIGDVGSIDVYTYCIIKTSSSTFKVLASITQFQ